MNLMDQIKQNVYIIAEAGVNHNGSLDIAKQLVDAAKVAGADAVKFQTYKTEDLVTVDSQSASYQTKNLGKETSQFDMLKSVELTIDDFRKIKKYCDEKTIQFLSTAHTMNSIAAIDKLVPFFKIGSGDLTNLPYIEALAKINKPIILSTGMATIDEIREAVQIIERHHKDIIILHCTTNYPCPKNDVNLRVIDTFKKTFPYPVGYSDHTEGIEISVMAAKYGAQVIEKHFTLDKTMQGPDHKASLEPAELAEMVQKIKAGAQIDIPESVLGDAHKQPTNEEMEIAKVARKSLVAACDITTGNTITEDMVTIKRPGIGMPAKQYPEIIGKKASRNIRKDTLFQESDFA